MAKKTLLKAPQTRRPSGTWPVVLSAAAAAGQTDGGSGLHHLLEEAGFAQEPEMTVIVKRPRPARERGKREIIDPYVDDVLDALRNLCA